MAVVLRSQDSFIRKPCLVQIQGLLPINRKEFMLHLLFDVALVVGAFAGGVLFGRKNPKKVEVAVAGAQAVEKKAASLFKK